MNHLSVIKKRLKKVKGKAVAAAGTAVAVVGTAVTSFALDTSATGPIGTAISGGISDYEAIFAMVLAAIVGFWALWRLQGIFFKK